MTRLSNSKNPLALHTDDFIIGAKHASECLATVRFVASVSEAEIGVEYAGPALNGLAADPCLAEPVAVAVAREWTTKLAAELTDQWRWNGKIAEGCAILEGALDRLVAAHEAQIFEAQMARSLAPPKRQRNPSRAAVIKRIEKQTGKRVVGIALAADGSITGVTFDTAPAAAAEANPFELEAARLRRGKQGGR